MKKFVSMLIICLMLVSLCACTQEPQGQTDPGATQPSSQATQPSQQESKPSESADAPTESIGQDLKALAESCIDKTVEELFALIGQPDSSEYAPSCLNPGVGEDGNLFYEDFTVYTYREGDEEVVTYVE